jgi:integrase
MENKKKLVRITTYHNYTQIITHLKQLLKLKIQDINANKLLNFRNELLNNRLSKNRVNKIMRVISEIYKHANIFFAQIDNVVKYIQPLPKPAKAEKVIWTEEEFDKFINSFDDEKEYIYKIFFGFLFLTGCRRSEALALKIKDIDFENKLVRITKNWVYIGKQDKKNHHMLAEPKTQSSIREIPLNDNLLANLNRWIDMRKEMYGFKDDWFLFSLDNIKPMSVTLAIRKLDYYAAKAGLHHISLHGFRHSHCSWLLNNGVDIYVISKRLGHANISITQEIYSHFYKNRSLEASNRINTLRAGKW